MIKYSPPKAEDSKVYSKEGGKCMANSRAGMTGTQVNTKPKGSQKGKQLTGYKIDLQEKRKTKKNILILGGGGGEVSPFSEQ